MTNGSLVGTKLSNYTALQDVYKMSWQIYPSDRILQLNKNPVAQTSVFFHAFINQLMKSYSVNYKNLL